MQCKFGSLFDFLVVNMNAMWMRSSNDLHNNGNQQIFSNFCEVFLNGMCYGRELDNPPQSDDLECVKA